MRIGAALAALALIIGLPATAQVATPPTPIPTPPVPPPPKLAPVPKIPQLSIRPPARPVIDVPDAPSLTPVAIPAEAAITPPNKADTSPPPASGKLTGPTAMTSPGASPSQIETAAFPLDAGNSQLPKADESKLEQVAATLARDPAARVEVRVFTPSTAHNESNARRLSLARYLAIRDVLLRRGVASGRIDGRPLISEPGELNPDRVELYIEH